MTIDTRLLDRWSRRCWHKHLSYITYTQHCAYLLCTVLFCFLNLFVIRRITVANWYVIGNFSYIHYIETEPHTQIIFQRLKTELRFRNTSEWNKYVLIKIPLLQFIIDETHVTYRYTKYLSKVDAECRHDIAQSKCRRNFIWDDRVTIRFCFRFL